MKRFLDFVISAFAIIILSPLLITVAAMVKVASPGQVLFRQQRIGKNFRPFNIYKFRTMVREAPNRGTDITFGDDPRITRLGRILRKTKIDELPQLLNVLRGDMSLVGPKAGSSPIWLICFAKIMMIFSKCGRALPTLPRLNIVTRPPCSVKPKIQRKNI